MKLRPFVVTLLASLGGVYAFNAVFATSAPSLEAAAAMAAAQTQNDVLVSDSTLYQRGWIRARLTHPKDGCPDLLVLGSSTTGTLATDMFPGMTVLNAWAGNVSVQDMESLTHVLAAAPCRPKAILLGVDMWWTGNPSWDFEGWQLLADDYVGYHAAHGGFARHVPLRIRWDDFKENLSFERSMDTLRAVRERGLRTDAVAKAGMRFVRGTEEEVCRELAGHEQNLRSFDGHYTKCPGLEMSEAAITKFASEYLTANIHNMGDWHEVATDRLRRLEPVIAGWRAQGIAVVMVGMPYHPVAWQKLTTDATTAPNVRELDQRLTAIAAATGATFLSLRDPASVPCGAEDFEDSHHPRATCTRRVAAKAAEALVGGRRAAAPE